MIISGGLVVELLPYRALNNTSTAAKDTTLLSRNQTVSKGNETVGLEVSVAICIQMLAFWSVNICIQMLAFWSVNICIQMLAFWSVNICIQMLAFWSVNIFGPSKLIYEIKINKFPVAFCLSGTCLYS